MLKYDVISELIDNKCRSSLGVTFSENKRHYFYDTGTGKVVRIDGIHQEFLTHLMDEKVEIADLYKYADNHSIDLDEFIGNIKKENMLSGVKIDKLYADDFVNQAKNAVQTNCNQLILELTGDCNMRCRYCVFHNRESKNFRGFNKQRMTKETAMKSLDYIYEHSDKDQNVHITFYGGEPLLEFDLMKFVIDTSKKMFNEDKTSFSFTSNLTLLTEEMADYLTKLKIFSILISLDGPREIHDRYRIYANKKGTYDDVIKNLKLFYKYKKINNSNANISFNAVYMPPFSIEKIEKIYNFFKENPDIPEGSGFSLTYPSPGTVPAELIDDKYYGDNSLAEAETLRIIHGDTRGDDEINPLVQRLYKIHTRMITNLPSNHVSLNGCCIPGSRRLYVTTNGDLHACERIGKSPLLGTLDTGIDENVLIDKYIKDYSDKSIEKCSKCWAVKLCHKCYADRMNEEGILPTAQNGCELFREGIKLDLALYHTLLNDAPEKLAILNQIEIE